MGSQTRNAITTGFSHHKNFSSDGFHPELPILELGKGFAHVRGRIVSRVKVWQIGRCWTPGAYRQLLMRVINSMNLTKPAAFR
jgi:hypothetical protein